MIVDVGVVGHLLAAPFRRTVDEVGPGIEIHCRHADLCETELVRPIEVALVGELIGLHDAALLFRDHVHELVDGRFAEADERNVVGVSPDVAAIVVDVGRNFAGRKGRIVGVILRAQQALLFGADERDQDRAARRLGQRDERTGDGHHLRDARRIVECAIVDAVAIFIRCADADVVVVRRVDDDLVRELRVAARNQAENIGRTRSFDLDIHRE